MDEFVPVLSVSFPVSSLLLEVETVTVGKNSLLDIFKSSFETLIFSLSAFNYRLLI